MKAIVTGADGFIGSVVVKNLLSHQISVLGMDLGKKPRRLTLEDSLFHYLPIPLQQIEKLSFFVKRGDYDVFYHFAWRGSGGEERGDVDVQLENVSLAVKALEEAALLGCKKFIFVSSVVELEANGLVYLDDSRPDSHYIYGGAKGACHMLLKPLANKLGIDLVWANIAGVYGVGDTTPNFVNSLLKKLDSADSLRFTEGRQYFDFVFIDDVAEAFRLLGEKGKANRAYVIGSGHPEPIRIFVEEILTALSSDKKPDFGAIPYSGQYLPKELFDIQKLSLDCGYQPKTDFCDGVKKTYEWLKASE